MENGISGAERIGRNIGLMMASRRTEPEELARYMAVSLSTFYRRLKKPGGWTVDNLSRMAKFWGITLSELTGEIRLISAERDVIMGEAEIREMLRDLRRKEGTA